MTYEKSVGNLLDIRFITRGSSPRLSRYRPRKMPCDEFTVYVVNSYLDGGGQLLLLRTNRMFTPSPRLS